MVPHTNQATIGRAGMKVFISWSGDTSRKIAAALFEWLPMVLQITKPYMSSESIEKGTRWASSIAAELEGSSVGILVLTPDNTTSPWIHFEAGALAKVVGEAKLAPLLFGLKPSDVGSPLSQFQVTLFTKDDVYKLLQSINAESGESALPDPRLMKMHDALWEDLHETINAILGDTAAAKSHNNNARRPNGTEILEEILTLVRQSHFLITSERAERTERELALAISDLRQTSVGGYWTEPRLDHLRELWAEGLTASQIAERLGGVSRNAVIGKAHRLGLQTRPTPPPLETGDAPIGETE